MAGAQLGPTECERENSMADNKQFKRRETPEVADDDPLAELTRIMGLQETPEETVEPPTDHSASDEADVEIDLEKELMGELSDEPANVAPLRAVPTETPAAQPESEFAVDVDQEMERALAGASEPEPEPIATGEARAETSFPEPSSEDAPKAPVLRPNEQETFEQLVARARSFPAPEPVDPLADEVLPKVVTRSADAFATVPAERAVPDNAVNQDDGRNTLEDELKTLLADIGDPPAEADVDQVADDTSKDDAGTYKPIFGRSNVQPLMPSAAPEPQPEPEVEEIDLGSNFEADLDDAVAEAASEAAGIPEVETVEVPEQAQSVADDLEIPELAVEPPAPVVSDHDDLEAEFSALFGDNDRPAVSPAAMPAPAVPAEPAASLEDPLEMETFDLEADDLDVAASSDEDRIAAASAEVAATAAMPVARQLSGGRESTKEAALETLAARAQSDGIAGGRSGRRGMMIAAVVVGVALLGGIGIFAMSFGGGETNAPPAVVLAEPGDVKIKPDDPGGTTVPNQDNKVYEKVSGESSVDSPSQEKLVTTAEEPVDVATRTVRTRVIDTAPARQPDTQKSEERIVPSQTENPTLTNDDVVVVVPRRVKTMIVKPDGTMVPREEAAPAVAPQITAASDPVATADDGQSALAGEGTVVTNPDGSAFIVPTPRPDRGPVASQNATAPSQNGESGDTTSSASLNAPEARTEVSPRQAAVEQPVTPAPTDAQETAATASPTPAAQPEKPAAASPRPAAGPYAIQIASQPTREGAQSTYQSLARRYGSVIGGRGVNIVKADIPGKGVYYRVRVPAGSKSDASSLCRSYKAAGGSCFVARQ